MSGCGLLTRHSPAASGPAWESFDQLVPASEWDGSIEVALAEPPQMEFSAYVVHMLLTNQSDKVIGFAPDYGIRALIYSKERKSWSEVGNGMTYLGDGEILVPRRSPESDWATSVTAIPNVEGASVGDVLRIAIVGSVLSDGVPNGETVGAYVDIDVKR
jgi:hypothetical protein